MRPLVVFGILLIAIGIAGLVIDNISFTEKRVVVDAGPIKAADQHHPHPSIPASSAILAGTGMVFGPAWRQSLALPSRQVAIWPSRQLWSWPDASSQPQFQPAKVPGPSLEA